MATPKLEKREPATLAYVEHVGPYNKIPFNTVIPKLYEWVREAKVRPGFYPICVFHGDPKTTPPENLRTDLGITVKGSPKPSGDIKIRRLPAMTVATSSHNGPASEYQNSYDALTEFIRKKGYVLNGPPMETYSKKPEVVGGTTIIHAKIMIPVKKI